MVHQWSKAMGIEVSELYNPTKHSLCVEPSQKYASNDYSHEYITFSSHAIISMEVNKRKRKAVNRPIEYGIDW